MAANLSMVTLQPLVSLLQLPDVCLVVVLCYCADDARSLCNAGRAHSRLHQAAVLARSNLKANVGSNREKLVLSYLSKHGQHIDSISFRGDMYELGLLHYLPSALTKLSSLSFQSLKLQLQPGSGYQGILGAAVLPPLKQLRFTDCRLLDGGEGLAAALPLLPGLEKLSLKTKFFTTSHQDSEGDILQVPLGQGLPGLQQLTSLQLAKVSLGPQADGIVGLQHVSRLVDLRLVQLESSYKLTAGMLLDAQHLTRLELSAAPLSDEPICFESAALDGKTLLQHVALNYVALCDNATGVQQLMSHLQHLQQLTFLSLDRTLDSLEVHPPAAAYSALTASSKLQHLGLSGSCLPAGVWQHVFPMGRQLPHLRVLDVSSVRDPECDKAAVPEGTRLVSCCPGLQSLNLQRLQYTTEGLASLQGLSSLTFLELKPVDGSSDGLDGVCQLTGLRRLSVQEPDSATEGFLLSLTQLRQLTYLSYWGDFNDCYRSWKFMYKVCPCVVLS